MKKLLYLVGLVFCIASCTDDYTDWANPLTNDPEGAKTVMMEVSPAAPIDYANVTSETVQLFVPTLEVSDDATKEYFVRVYNDDMSDYVEIAADENGYVNADDLKAIVEQLYGKAPTPRRLNLVVSTYTYIGEMAIKNVGGTTATVTLTAPHISEAYYVVGGKYDWGQSAAEKSQKFSHSDKNVYDDPVFTIEIDASFDEDGNRTDTWFAIGDDEALDAIVNGDWSKLLGTTLGNGNNGNEGTLAPRSELSDDGSFMMPASDEAVGYRITINMMDYTYKIEPISNLEDTYYIIGTPQGWNPDDTSFPVKNSGINTSLDPVFKVRLPATGSNVEFKLCPQSGIGSWDKDFTADPSGEEGKLASNNAGGNITIENVDGAVAYDVWFNLRDKEWGYMPVMADELFFEIGNESGWSTSHGLKGSGKVYTGFYFLNGEFKFKPNADNWDNDIEYDGAAEGATGKVADNGGSNMPAPETGFYKVILDLNAMTYTLVKINTVGVIGDATAGGWSEDQDMTWNPDGGYWYIDNLTLNDGTIKFRGNDNWDGDLDLGGNPNCLTIGGSNISVTAGTYDIKLFQGYSGYAHAVITKK
ncbi:MAG: DUF5115 domain-containing protein [Prevotella sp.]|nr:DUF5115 domain-containing protein [Prevotella sp.]